jgi:hypothetical protein
MNDAARGFHIALSLALVAALAWQSGCWAATG